MGAGLIGRKRAMVLESFGADKVIAVADVNLTRAKKLADEIDGCEATSSWKEIANHKQIDTVVVATTHNNLATISLAALSAGKHVLCEKPLGIKSAMVAKCVKMARKKKLMYKVGFNHRFHPGIAMAHDMFVAGKIGKLMYIKAAYGIGGRPGYEKEWRMDKEVSGGGELIDQGAHLIDLSRWFMGEITSVKAELLTSFWPVKVEDNVFLLLRNRSGLAEIHASWTEWKNRFTFEIYGVKGYLKINGLGGSYGPEVLTFGRRVPGQAPLEKFWKFEDPDQSWRKEWLNFRQAILRGKDLNGSGVDGLEVLRLIEKIYKQKKTK
ncbi:MAG: Oxidoreductase domain protein [Candidatus Daviesbacteria bacterium GW2011_GWA1_38_7]|uniref:Oxidoreductase domain protein n=1 Tax=Candidatus Giovannonibacteria bacterium GW2011_GWA2_44_26 TaxID=1618648 RepID=A0A0G1KWR5_9BACT|nr:MAG: Oxidoreductase domain protein [Candidatus Daviesbacteria bacterium GW2011_GWA1_38_7]KKT60737.1 MAG: Oxidoreductase domain protein [Candidatus Giovannonibacteria bacterium GW2011_GWA2_44_26]